jgi:hypothetical protein
MRSIPLRRAMLAWAVLTAATSGACGSHESGFGNPGSSGGMSSGGADGGSVGADGAALADGASAIDAGGVTAPSTPFDAGLAAYATRKVKNLLVGQAPTDGEVATVTNMGAAGLQQLIITWMMDMTTQPLFRSKMIFFLRNTFQQTGFTATEDFKPQLLENGGFDFGPFGVSAVGDDAFANLVQNLQDSFALTVWELIQEGQPFTQALTTQKFRMTTALKSLYLQIEMPNDQPYAFNLNNKNPLPWKVDYSGNPIALTDTLNPNSPNYMVFSDEPPANAGSFFGGGTQFPTCRGGTVVDSSGNKVTQGTFKGYAQLFQRLIGFTPRYPFAATPTCWEHPSKPYFTEQDTSDWQWVTITPMPAGGTYIQPFDLPTLRQTTTLPLALTRVGFYTTPAFLAIWNTNDSNQHRVTANQALLAALGQSFTSDSVIVPISESGLDPNHATTGSECYGCHKSLDPMREFWANQFDFNDRNDFPTSSFNGAVPNPRPTTLGGTFAFGTVNSSGKSILDFGPLLGQGTDGDPNTPLNLFASGIVQKLCFYANSAGCDPGDPTFRAIALDFQNGFDFPALVKEFFASPLVTGATATQSFPQNAVPVSIVRRDHFCAALSNRLSMPDLCALAVTLPTQAQSQTATIAASVAADAFSRGSQTPVTPADPTLFYRAAVEELCENLAAQIVDASGGSSVYKSSDVTTAISDMVSRIMGYPPSDPHYAQAVQILQSHQQSAVSAKASATNALRSTFVLACESPTSVGMGL